MLNSKSPNDDLAERLRELPVEKAPRGAWDEIVARAEREGLLEQRPPALRRVQTWSLGIGLAAGLLAAILVVRQGGSDAGGDTFAATPSAESAAVAALQRQSLLLEEVLRLTPPQARVVPVGMASRVTAAEDRIVAIDRRLAEGASTLDEATLTALWSERAAMMNALVQLRIQGAGSDPSEISL